MRLPFSRVSFCMWGENRWWISLLLTALLGTMSFVAMVAWQRFARNASVKDDLGRMQGRWEATVDGTKVVMTIEGSEMSLMPVVDMGLFERLVMRLSGGSVDIEPERGTIRLDPALYPKAIDFIGPKGKNRPGIYELNGPTFNVCLWTGPAAAPRPASFAASGKGYSTYVFRRSDR